MTQKDPKGRKKTDSERKSRRKIKSPRATEIQGRERGYVAGVVAGKTKKQAALDAGYSEHVARDTKKKLDSRPAVQSMFTTLIEKAGISDEKMARRLAEGIDGKVTKLAQSEGKFTDSRTLIDLEIRLHYLELVLKLKGHLIDKHELRMTRTLEEILETSHENA